MVFRIVFDLIVILLRITLAAQAPKELNLEKVLIAEKPIMSQGNELLEFYIFRVYGAL